MASYKGNYQSDSGKLFQCVRLQVYQVEITVGIRGIRTATTIEEDKKYLPQVYFDTAKSENGAACTLPITARYLLIYLSETTYIHVDLPFLPSSGQSNQFFGDLTTNFASKYTSLGMEGERLPANWLPFYVK